MRRITDNCAKLAVAAYLISSVINFDNYINLTFLRPPRSLEVMTQRLKSGTR